MLVGNGKLKLKIVTVKCSAELLRYFDYSCKVNIATISEIEITKEYRFYRFD